VKNVITKISRKGNLLIWFMGRFQNMDDLYEELKKSGLKMSYIADKLGINRRTLYGKLKNDGKYKLKDSEKEIIEELIGRVKNE
jgi:transcriptional regulator of acetoin/glycerol metabolism